MASPVPRLRMFAGPNGSGKSTLKDYLAPEWLGVYVNAELQSFLAASSLLAKQNLRDEAINIDRVRHRVAMGGHPVDTDKIISRYENSLNLPFDAVLNTDRAWDEQHWSQPVVSEDLRLEMTQTTMSVSTGQAAGEVTGEVTGEVARLLLVCHDEMDRKTLQAALGLKGQGNFRERYLAPALSAGWIEMSLPDKPNSRNQKYRLTRQGQALRAALIDREKP